MDEQKLKTAVSVNQQLKEKGDEIINNEDKVLKEDENIKGHKAKAIWIEKNMPRTREFRDIFHKNKEVARSMAKEAFKEYADMMGKDEYSDLEIELEPILAN